MSIHAGTHTCGQSVRCLIIISITGTAARPLPEAGRQVLDALLLMISTLVHIQMQEPNTLKQYDDNSSSPYAPKLYPYDLFRTCE